MVEVLTGGDKVTYDGKVLVVVHDYGNGQIEVRSPGGLESLLDKGDVKKYNT